MTEWLRTKGDAATSPISSSESRPPLPRETVSQCEKSRPRHPEPSEGSAFLPYSRRIGVGVPKPTKQKSRFFVAPLLRMTLRHSLRRKRVPHSLLAQPFQRVAARPGLYYLSKSIYVRTNDPGGIASDQRCISLPPLATGRKRSRSDFAARRPRSH
jgi:hypothetical protein